MDQPSKTGEQAMSCATQRRVLRIRLGIVMASFIVVAWHWAAFAAQGGKCNVLFIAVDDLRPELGCYGTPIIKSPHIDALAQTGTVFNRAYCQQAVCSPSRTSLLTGRRPDTTRIYDLQTHFRLHQPDIVTLPQYFKEHGYHTQSLGKIYHGLLDDPQSWSVQSWYPKDHMYGKPENQAAVRKMEEQLRSKGKLMQVDAIKRDPKTRTVLKISYKGGVRAIGPAWEDPDVPDNALRDGMLADKAIEALGQVKDSPFFLAVGFYRPHLPFVAPKKYFDLYRPQELQLAGNPYPPKDVPKIALMNYGELRSYSDIPKQGAVSDEKARELIHAYYATVSYVDAQIGRVLAELDRLVLRERTVVVLWGDHGWQLGEHGLWCKHTNFEVATRVAMIISVPGQKNVGAKTEALSEFVDIYPTLVELCGLPMPEGLEGASLVPVMNAPDQPWKRAAFSQYPRGKAMGYSMRTDRYRYTEWAKPGKPAIGVELYDHKEDPHENINLAGQPEHKDLIAQLSKQLHAGWREAMPPDAKR
jgi:iduronate 2-sulfatase